jgi:ABC-type nitrate/sulfonate/bicarbonate transport system ATPase subunit
VRLSIGRHPGSNRTRASPTLHAAERQGDFAAFAGLKAAYRMPGLQPPEEERPIAFSLESVDFTYGVGPKVISDLSLTIRQGTSVGIVGPSGCGKSTLLSLLAGLYQPDAGTITRSLGDPARHRLTMMFQQDTLLPWLSAVENIKLFYKFHRHNRTAVDARVAELVSMARLAGFERAYPYQLSGGMRRRVAFLTAVAPLPNALLLDEPFSSLDEPTRVALHQDAFDIIRRLNMTVVLVTHDLAEALTLCDEVLILTQRPARIFARHVVPFGSRRNLLQIRQTAEFLELYGVLWRELSVQIAGSGVEASGGS